MDPIPIQRIQQKCILLLANITSTITTTKAAVWIRTALSRPSISTVIIGRCHPTRTSSNKRSKPGATTITTGTVTAAAEGAVLRTTNHPSAILNTKIGRFNEAVEVVIRTWNMVLFLRGRTPAVILAVFRTKETVATEKQPATTTAKGSKMARTTAATTAPIPRLRSCPSRTSLLR